ncbi:cobyric acid synthase [Gorillibacterium sp. sgz5001074]|uniref:cobyric acid synthase n=1 Tax=Gorillibacterium sp. sgz5001074 TaxID=3446695 RepID=UPI003F666EB5
MTDLIIPKPGGIRGSTEPAPTLMLQGTASDVGKSILTAALCRIFVQDGLRTAPFKSQNMSLNSYITPDGKEIGRAQGLQADACRIAASTDMNPILLKPKKDMVSQVVVHGKPLRDYEARAYREEYLVQAEGIVKEALDRLRAEYDLVVIEGAGSPAEVNLKDRDIVNMRLAGWAGAPVLLVADIDRGGVFASIVGTLEILEPHERDRVRGFIINKFRGDVTLLKPGLDWLEQRTGKPVLGVIPYLPKLDLEDEDSASLDAKLSGRQGSPLPGSGTSGKALDIAVVRLPRLSNFTDFDPLPLEPDVSLRYVTEPGQLGEPDALILPGSKNTVDDLLFLRETGLEAAILRYVREGGELVGICAGYQMLGRRLLDPERLESDREETDALGLLPSETVFTPDKRTVRVAGTAEVPGAAGLPYPIRGYEIHMGRTRYVEPEPHPFRIARTGPDGMPEEPPHGDGAAAFGGKVWGTYVHGILHNDGFRRCWLDKLRTARGWEPVRETLDLQSRREAAFDRLAGHVRAHLDMERIYEMIRPTETDEGGQEP